MTETDTATAQAPTADDERRRAKREIEELSHAAYDVAAPAPGASGPPTECDVIMKGGITSGVVYPLTICRLATKYRLKNIGGTSAGAIAAVVAAAAEYRRQHDPVAPAVGYQALAVLPLDVSKRLATLFQPPAETKPIFGVLLAALGPGRLRAGVVALVKERLAWFLGGLLLVLVVAAPALLLNGFPDDRGGWARFLLGLLLPLLLGLVIGVVAALVGFIRKAVKVLPRHDYGLTDGATHSDNATEPALTEWLNQTVNTVAGLPQGRCLTLGDLWGDEGLAAWQEYAGEVQTKQPPITEVRRKRAIDLETMTTNLTVRRPFRLPFRQQVFLFDRDEMLGLFPGDVVDTMVAGLPPSAHLHPTTAAPLYYFPGPGAPEDGQARPGPEALPVVVMARISLSFPGLIAAVPLYAVDYNGDQSVVRHLFSDGGISSNFPMHFFDSLLPTRPTFGINLASPHPQHPEMTWLPQAAEGGIIARAQPFVTVPGFISALRDSVQNWSDNTQITQRGYAERVVEIRMRPGEGGFNLEMPDDVIMALVGRGAEAGEKLLGFQWDPHRVIRYRIAMSRLTEVLEGLELAWTDRDYAGLVEDYPMSGAPASSYLDGVGWRKKDLAATKALLDLVDVWHTEDWPALRQDRPAPAPVMRLAPE